MENTTITIDVRKLQLLNDRICQTLDALNQIRYSAQNVRPTAMDYGHGFAAHPAYTPSVDAWGRPIPVNHLAPAAHFYGSAAAPLFARPEFSRPEFRPEFSYSSTPSWELERSRWGHIPPQAPAAF